MVVPGQPVSGTRHKVEQLRNWEEKVEDLRDEKEQHRFAEVAEDCDNGEWHSGEIAECVADKHLCWIPVNNIAEKWM